MSKNARTTRLVLAAFATLVGLLLAPGVSAAATISSAPSATAPDSATSGDAHCSLREALLAMNQGSIGTFTDCTNTGAAFGTGDTINLQAGTYQLTMAAGGEIDFNPTSGPGTLTITGAGSAQTTIAAATGNRVIATPGADPSLTLSHLAITGGHSTSDGGGIRFIAAGANTLTLDDVDVHDNTATIGPSLTARGGGVFVRKTGGGSYTLNITGGTTFENNHAGGTQANESGAGGAIASGNGTTDDGSITMTGGSITGNSAGGFFSGAQGDGGGIYTQDLNGTVTLTNVAVDGNEVGGNGSASAGFGGGIELNDTAATPTDLSLTGGSVSSNHVAPSATNFTSGFGGGIALQAVSAPSTLTIDGTEISDNTANSFAGSANPGGGIYAQSSGVVGITGATISGNTSSAAGGGINRSSSGSPADTITDSTISGNTGNQGGGLFLADLGGTTDAQVTGTTISGNHALGVGFTIGGGGIEADSDLTLLNSTVYGNDLAGSFMGEGGGGIRTLDPGAGPPTVTLDHATVMNNSAAGSSGGNLYLTGAPNSNKGQIRDSIIAAGTAPTGSNCFQTNAGVIQSNDFNVEGSSSTQCGFTQAHDLVTSAPLGLGSLGPNGGPTQTVPLLAGSSAIDLVTSGCPPPATDQRGEARGGLAFACDAGAFENQPPSPELLTNQTVQVGQTLSFTFHGTDADPADTLTLGATALPPGATFETATGQFDWTPTADQVGTFPGVTFTVSDGIHSRGVGISITVTAVPPPPPPSGGGSTTTPPNVPATKKKCKKKKNRAAAAKKKCKKKKK